MFWDIAAPVYDVFVNGINRKMHKALKRMVREEIGYNSILHLAVPEHFRYVDNPYLSKTEHGWQIDLSGFRRSLMELYQRYHLPLMVDVMLEEWNFRHISATALREDL